ncbi:DUF1513 domain-containing protein [Roseibium algae]|uniref:DUF1513 domain-containing protein n=1 Tax=Roseibium algae TaxID=3123038 RepID=A0ABU8TL33_9HYPH
MHWTATDRVEVSRRAFLTGLGGLTALTATGLSKGAMAEGLLNPAFLGTPLFASARREANGNYALAIIDDAGQDVARVPLPSRGHGMAVSPDKRRLMAFARRPGTFALLIDPFEQTKPKILTSIAGRHFYGHGCFSADGRLVYAVENDYEAVRGVIGVYDVSGREIRRLGEFETGGIGPHDLLLTDHGRTLVVANGGIQTHPEKPRQKLNIDTMAPSVAFINIETGDILVRHALTKDLHQLSLRHMAKDGQGQVWIGGQYEGDDGRTPPLVARMTLDDAPRLTEIPGTIGADLDGYIGSVVANASGDTIATSAPRGGKILFWSAATGDLIGTQDVIDGCGLAPIDDRAFLISDGTGGLSYLEDPTSRPDVLARPAGVAWDNHMFAL